METVLTTAGALCVALVISALFELLVPKGSFERLMKLALSVFILILLIMPFARGKIVFDNFFLENRGKSQSEMLAEQTRQRVIEVTTDNIKYACENLLKNNGYTPVNIYIETHIDENDSISINKARFIVAHGDKSEAEKSELEKTLADELGVTPEVTFN